MGAHAKSGPGIRAALIGALATGAALTGLGLTAAALDSGGRHGPQGAAGTGPTVDLGPDGLGAPVPVADTTAIVPSQTGQSGGPTANPLVSDFGTIGALGSASSTGSMSPYASPAQSSTGSPATLPAWPSPSPSSSATSEARRHRPSPSPTPSVVATTTAPVEDLAGAAQPVVGGAASAVSGTVSALGDAASSLLGGL